MKAADYERYGLPDVVDVKEVERPTIKDDEIIRPMSDRPFGNERFVKSVGSAVRRRCRELGPTYLN